MALRSGLMVDSIWAINALNVLLYDDLTGVPPSLGKQPELLNVLVDHFIATLSLIFPNYFTVLI